VWCPVVTPVSRDSLVRRIPTIGRRDRALIEQSPVPGQQAVMAETRSPKRRALRSLRVALPTWPSAFGAVVRSSVDTCCYLGAKLPPRGRPFLIFRSDLCSNPNYWSASAARDFSIPQLMKLEKRLETPTLFP
jgi:hypothetical protein